MKAGPERELAARYMERASAAGKALGFSGMEVREIEESRARRKEERMAEEAKALQFLQPAGAYLLSFDEGGKSLSSVDFAALLGRLRDQGVPALAMVIGGADGLDGKILAASSLCLSFGAMTWPHQLVRIMAAEQIYRAMTILSHHPYHRA